MKAAIANDADITDTEASVGLPVVKSTIQRLFILVIGIRRSARQPHKLRQESQAADFSSLSLLLKNRYPSARNSLRQQLAHSIHVRGTSLQYLQSHNRKIAHQRQRDDSKISNQNINTPVNQTHGTPIELQLATAEPETVASAVSPSEVVRFRRKALGKSRPSHSIISTGSTVTDEDGNELPYPPMPKAESETNYVPCTICSEPLEVTTLTEEGWK